MPTSRSDLPAGTPGGGQISAGLHPLAVWAWAGAVGLAASRTRNVVLLLSLLAGLAVVVVVARQCTRAPSSRVFAAFLRLGIAIIVVRIVFSIVFGTGSTGGQVLFELPQVALPDWMAGIRLGGPVTSEMLGQAVADGLWLATVLACVGAATAVADPADLLRAVPGALYELGVSVVVALSFTPRLIDDAVRARQARRLRGQTMRGLRAWNRTALGVLEGGLDQAVTLAASMDARGYGRIGADSATHRLLASVCMLGGLRRDQPRPARPPRTESPGRHRVRVAGPRPGCRCRRAGPGRAGSTPQPLPPAGIRSAGTARPAVRGGSGSRLPRRGHRRHSWDAADRTRPVSRFPRSRGSPACWSPPRR